VSERPRERTAVRRRVAVRAAELMYFDKIKEYLRAKRKAAAELGVTVFPNNAEIRDQLDTLAMSIEGPARQDRLLRMRMVALRIMQVLEEFEPRLIGSVLTGHIKSTSDIDLHAFTENHAEVGEQLLEAGYDVEYEIVKTRKGGEFMDFPHYYLCDADTPVEISVYPLGDLKRPQKSSITHKTMERATISAVRRLIASMQAAQTGTSRA
jgi:predicted nucleotidyltransferase